MSCFYHNTQFIKFINALRFPPTALNQFYTIFSILSYYPLGFLTKISKN